MCLVLEEVGFLCGEDMSPSYSRAQGGSGKGTDLTGGSVPPDIGVPAITVGPGDLLTPIGGVQSHLECLLK